MEAGKTYPEIPNFREFCNKARDVPHVLPHNFCSALEGYFQVMYNDPIVYQHVIFRPYMPQPQRAYACAEAVRKYLYPLVEHPFYYKDPAYYPHLTDETKRLVNVGCGQLLAEFTAEEKAILIQYLSESFDRILAMQKTEFMPKIEATSLREISPVIQISSRAADYITSCTHLNISAIPKRVNPILGEYFKPNAYGFSRLRNLDKTVEYKGK